MLRRRLVINLVLLTLLAGVLPSQEGTPILKSRTDIEAIEMLLEELTVQVEILGLISETRLTMTFYNPHDRVMEGELTFPLPKGARVCGYALDVNGSLVDGVAVEKEKARRTFEAEVRRGVDPGIVEELAGNHFRTRVYPLPPKGRRTVMVRYLNELRVKGDSAFYHLPLSVKYALKKFSFRADVLGETVIPEIEDSPMEDVHFVSWKKAFRAETKAENVTLKGNFSVELPKIGQRKLFVQKSPTGRLYFYGWDRQLEHLKSEPVRKVRRLTLFWDASGSRSLMDHEREYAFLRSWFAEQKESVTVRLVLLRHRIHEAQMFKEVKDAEEIIRSLKAVYYDGGTNLASLAEDRAPSDLAFLFSDGLGNFEADDGQYRGGPLFTVASHGETDFSRLRLLALRAGGDLVDLQTETPSAAAKRVMRPVFRFLGVTEDTKGIGTIYPSIPTPISEFLIFSGQMHKETIKLGLRYGSSFKETAASSFADLLETVSDGTLLETFWAQKKIEELSLEGEKRNAEILETGKRFGLVTSQTSLIVLERLEQYIEHHIEPPKTLPQIREQYLQHLKREEIRRKDREKSKMDQVMAMWRDRLKWFHTDFSKIRVEDPKKVKNREGNELGMEERVSPQMARDSMAEREAMPVMAQTAAATPPAEMKKDARDSGDKTFRVDLKPFDPHKPYLDRLKQTDRKGYIDTYLLLRREYGDSPSFYVDCADFFLARGMNDLALQVLSNLSELKLEDARLLRVLAGRLTMQGKMRLARVFYEKVLEIRSEEPQSYRDLALVLADLKEYRRSVELLNHLVFTDWDRFNGIEVVALMEQNEIIYRAHQDRQVDLPVSPAFVQLIDTDLRIVLSWDADATDIDLHVVEPTGEEVYYSHKLSSSGGLVSNDFTQGYGPEEFVVRKAIPGRYKVRAKYFGTSAQSLLGPVTVRVDIFTQFGRRGQRKRTVFLRLEEAKEMLDVADVEIAGKR